VVLAIILVLGFKMENEYYVMPAAASILLLFTQFVFVYTIFQSLFKEWSLVVVVILLFGVNQLSKNDIIGSVKIAYGIKYTDGTLNFKENKISRFVTIMQGCENFCTYCVVPYVRGKERSRNPESIIKEISLLAKSGVKEINLLGQNVNSYGKQEGQISFAELLVQVSNIRDIQRIRFATSHPKDLSMDLIHAIRDIDKVCNHLHLPVQSGSDKILKKMNRGYSRRKYIKRILDLKNNALILEFLLTSLSGFLLKQGMILMKQWISYVRSSLIPYLPLLILTGLLLLHQNFLIRLMRRKSLTD